MKKLLTILVFAYPLFAQSAANDSSKNKIQITFGAPNMLGVHFNGKMANKGGAQKFTKYHSVQCPVLVGSDGDHNRSDSRHSHQRTWHIRVVCPIAGR